MEYFMVQYKDKKLKGFTLIEVMIVVAIIGILAAIAYPSYMDSVRKSNRADAKAALNDAAQQMQRCYTLKNSFENCTVASTSPEGFYKISLSNVTASSFDVTATAVKSPQTGDSGCTTMKLDNLGKKTPDPDTDASRCW